MTCRICAVRRPRRYCPGVSGDICSICCGTEREVTVQCPFECPYLQESRLRDKQPIANPDTFPNQDVRITDQFLARHEALLIFLASGLSRAALDPSVTVIDNDVKDAIEAAIRTYRTLESGLYYESKPSNPIAATLFESIKKTTAEYSQRLKESAAGVTVRDAEILGILVFLQRLEIQHNNGRPKGRAFIDFLRQYFPQKPVEAPSLLL